MGSWMMHPMDTTSSTTTDTASTTATDNTRNRLLRRATDGHILGGVAAGLAEYLNIDVAVVRIAFVGLGLLGGIAVPLYVAGWLLIPEEGSESTIADDLLGHTHQS
jgi:phage shock protein PspC (stress-responsive transcriptional regulator)